MRRLGKGISCRDMKLVIAISGLVAMSLFSGCMSREGRVTNTRAPGPAIGSGIGYAAGAVVGNVAGGVVAVGEGAAAGAAVPFDNDHRVVRTWRTETTSDGRVIQVPVEIEVDKDGRPLQEVK